LSSHGISIGWIHPKRSFWDVAKEGILRKFIAYYRVSTQKQQRSGLGLDAQREMVAAFVRSSGGQLLAEWTETETGKGSNALDKRPQLRAALDECRRTKATLLIAKLDRLARNVHFVSGLLESKVNFIAADMPEADRTMIQIYSAMAEMEARQISTRTKAALAQAKARGVVLGRAGPRNLRPHLEAQVAASSAFCERLRGQFESYSSRGLTQREMVAEMNALGITAPRGGAWRLAQIQRVLRQLSTTRA
jgi:DNA invertase Pin-like site-specific DNA recombinase